MLSFIVFILPETYTCCCNFWASYLLTSFSWLVHFFYLSKNPLGFFDRIDTFRVIDWSSLALTYNLHRLQMQSWRKVPNCQVYTSKNKTCFPLFFIILRLSVLNHDSQRRFVIWCLYAQEQFSGYFSSFPAKKGEFFIFLKNNKNYIFSSYWLYFLSYWNQFFQYSAYILCHLTDWFLLILLIYIFSSYWKILFHLTAYIFFILLTYFLFIFLRHLFSSY